jgi:oligoribonuclease (3'-5' exoribonuclease)
MYGVEETFLMEGPWVTVLEYLHYRILDISAIKEGVRR